MIRDPTGRYALPAQDTTALEHSRSLQLSPRNLSVANWMDGLRSSPPASSTKPSRRRSAPPPHSNAESLLHKQSQSSQQRMSETSSHFFDTAEAGPTATTATDTEYNDYEVEDDSDDPAAWDALADALAQRSTNRSNSAVGGGESAVDGSARSSQLQQQKAREKLVHEVAGEAAHSAPLSRSRLGLLQSSASTAGGGSSLAGQTPLHVAARAGKLEVVSSLIRAKVRRCLFIAFGARLIMLRLPRGARCWSTFLTLNPRSRC